MMVTTQQYPLSCLVTVTGGDHVHDTASHHPGLRAQWARYNNLEVQKTAWTEYIVPRGPNFQETIAGWMNNSLLSGIITIRFVTAGVPVGNVAINSVSTKNREGSLVINIMPQYWGKGYATEVLECVLDHAFKNLALHRISLGVSERNERASGVYRKLGFVEEGRLRKAVWLDGAWQDVILMAVLEDEWTERARAKQTVVVGSTT